MCHFFFKCLENLSVKPCGSEFLNEKVFNFRFIFFLDTGLCRFSICVMVYASFVKVCNLRNLTLKFQIYLLKIFIISFLLLLFFKCIRSIALFFLIPDTGNVMSVLFLIIFDRDLSILLFFLEN